MKVSRDALEIFALFVVLIVAFVLAGLVWWGWFLAAVGLVLLGFEWYLWEKKGETLSQQFWRLWRERPKVALILWCLLVASLIVIALHLKANP